jgi:hypothetical protein
MKIGESLRTEMTTSVVGQLPSISKAIGSTPSNGKKTTINKMTQTKKK